MFMSLGLSTACSIEMATFWMDTIDGGSTLNWLPLDRWMVYYRENPSYQWMMTGGTPISGNHYVLNFQTQPYVMVLSLPKLK